MGLSRNNLSPSVQLRILDLASRLSELRCDIQRVRNEFNRILQKIGLALMNQLASQAIKKEKTKVKELVCKFEAKRDAKFEKKTVSIETNVNIKAILKMFEGMKLNGAFKTSAGEAEDKKSGIAG